MLNDPNPAEHRRNVARWIWLNQDKRTRGGVPWPVWFSNFFGTDYYKYCETLMIEKARARAGATPSKG